MNFVTIIAIILATLGSALISGVFFAFSSFVMKALARVPSAKGIAAMQSINVAVLNPSFLGVFMGTAATSLLVAVLAVTAWDTVSAPWLVGGASLYLVGTFLVTGLGNVPLNDELARVQPNDPAAMKIWDHYLLLNTVRTAAAGCAALMFIVGLIQYGS